MRRLIFAVLLTLPIGLMAVSSGDLLSKQFTDASKTVDEQIAIIKQLSVLVPGAVVVPSAASGVQPIVPSKLPEEKPEAKVEAAPATTPWGMICETLGLPANTADAALVSDWAGILDYANPAEKLVTQPMLYAILEAVTKAGDEWKVAVADARGDNRDRSEPLVIFKTKLPTGIWPNITSNINGKIPLTWDEKQSLWDLPRGDDTKVAQGFGWPEEAAQ